jgi:hypothetical protein
VLLATVPMAAPSVPRIGIRTTLNAIVSAVISTPSRSGVRESPAARNAPLSMKKIIMPRMPTRITRRNGSASACTSGAAFTSPSRAGAVNHPTAPSAADSPAAVRNA